MFRKLLVAAALSATLVGTMVAPASAASAAPAAPARTAVTQSSTAVTAPDGLNSPGSTQIRISFGRGVYVNMYGGEIRILGSALIAVGGGAAVAGCGAIAKLPAVPAKILQVICLAVPSATVATVLKWIRDFYNSKAFRDNWCYQAKVFAIWPDRPVGFHVVPLGNCRLGAII